jgi:6-pyruvoyltetrahydropterin/6-carboxytetrahydropterin synthase
MPICTLTRRVTFAAAHRYRRPDWDDATNLATFGRCAWPNFHGHSYTCDVTVGGPIDPATGFVADLGVLDEILRREVYERFDHRNINTDIPEFADGKLIPTGEELAKFIFQRVDASLRAHPSRPAAQLRAVTIAEDQTLSATYAVD